MLKGVCRKTFIHNGTCYTLIKRPNPTHESGTKLKAYHVSNIKFLLTESNAFLKSVANIKPCIFSLSVNTKISSIALTASNIDFPFTHAF